LAGAVWIRSSRVLTYAKSNDQISAPQQGFLAPDFTLSSLAGTDISLSDFKGKPIIINFWASWCPPCRAEMPAFNQVYSEYQELIILAINSTHQDSLQAASDFVETNKLDYLILMDYSGEIGNLYNLYSLPTTFFIDSNGIIQKVLIGGPLPTALLRVEIEKILENEE
jgi:thiol-disulfide isomerase/thioredoxin